jgi:hypothetical protein
MATPATATPALDSPPRLRWFDKFILLVALAIGVALFVTVGWMALAPRDPHGAVSLVTATSPLAVILQATLLVAVAAVVATVMIGTKLPDVGVFAAALGLALASLQGNTSAYLLISVAGGDRGAERALAGKLAIESVVWFLLIVVAIAVSGAVMRWCLGMADRRGEPAENPGAGHRGNPLARMAASECPGIARLAPDLATANPSRASVLNGLKITAIMTVAGLLIFATLVSGYSPQMIRHGQTCFAAFTAFYLGGWIAYRNFSARTALWAILAVPLTAIAGYGWTMVYGAASGRYAHLASIPVSDFLRALPITFISVGTLGALFAHWAADAPKPAPKPKGTERPRKPRRATR